MPHILVIEDDVEFRAPLVATLTNDGHHISVAGDGVEALKILKGVRPDLIISDVLMPHMDGIEMLLELARSGNAIPIISMSGGRRAITSEFNLASAGVMGVNVTLAKPFSRDELRRAIKHALASPSPA